MAELCMSSTTFKPQASLIYSYFSHITAFILSHPLYFSYFIFFSPYFLKLLSFLSPLFITTSFLLLLLGLAHTNSASTLFEPRQNFLHSTFHVIQRSLREKLGLERQEIISDLEECEAYKLVFVFDTPTSDMVEHTTGEEYLLQSFDDKEVVVDFSVNVGVKSAGGVHQSKSSDSQVVEEKRLQDFFEVSDDFDDNVVEKNVDPISTKSIKVVEEHVDESKMRKTVDPIITKSIKVVEENVDESKVRKGSEAKDVNIFGGNNGGGHTKKVMSLAKPFFAEAIIHSGEYTSNLGSYGSMRKEKEWNRTLACKLFEERHNTVVEGDERIDALWERHESEELSKSMRMATDTNKKKNMKTSTLLNFYGDVEEEDDDNDNEELEITKVQLCCLQAFKFSAGKMNLGMRKPNLVKFSKALKGIGWLHYAKRHGKREKS
ncbi:Acidic leucine-rich nuclear phosphoprotein 32 family B protein [Heracleum sosnowskyi]|uniref:Acidic leucine-rich nuclear phosphoprotein 32 family B protein n=1 Tax=Heracleum sosnowskyi TaxID=360622 RepID=A0AAD8M0E8_9APIA|nr:Acidic leucine-rich nuclear phosphoprotein 32 family B protein [Heracleum sosnowskyi]